ncbi:MAG: FAD-dependent oxidoreductase, partial [Planctomycetaceae bacterium]|nr:FAD-dependent oxidoreductase [Planctomycetaceae bacterium]
WRDLLRFDLAARNRMTPQEFYHSDHPEGSAHAADASTFTTLLDEFSEQRTRDFVTTLIHSDLATEPHHTNHTYGLHNYLMNDPAYMQLYGIEGGNERLPQELAARIVGTKLLEHTVERVQRGADGRLRVQATHGGEHTEHAFDFVVIALPHNHLRSVKYAGDRLSPAVEDHIDYYDYPAHYLRISLLFESRFWESRL